MPKTNIPKDPRIGREYREPTKEPCNDCPFRRNALQGWLGEATPESFIECIQREAPLPCHQTIDYEDRDWKRKWEAAKTGKTCAGALVMSANMCKSPRDKNFPRMEPDDVAVFSTPYEFIEYHRGGTTKSWEDE